MPYGRPRQSGPLQLRDDGYGKGQTRRRARNGDRTDRLTSSDPAEQPRPGHDRQRPTSNCYWYQRRGSEKVTGQPAPSPYFVAARASLTAATSASAPL